MNFLLVKARPTNEDVFQENREMEVGKCEVEEEKRGGWISKPRPFYSPKTFYFEGVIMDPDPPSKVKTVIISVVPDS